MIPKEAKDRLMHKLHCKQDKLEEKRDELSQLEDDTEALHDFIDELEEIVGMYYIDEMHVDGSTIRLVTPRSEVVTRVAEILKDSECIVKMNLTLTDDEEKYSAVIVLNSQF